MMSHDNTNLLPPCSSKQEPPRSSSNPKKSSNSPPTNSSSSKAQQQQDHQQQQVLNCPRCDSPNTKFCYYNNYSLTQPRHFCKTCRRYWTKGGALRNVPIGGGCRKNNKKLKSSSASSLSRLSSSSDNSSSDLPALKFFHGVSPAVDFQLGSLSFPRITSSSTPNGIYSNFANSYADGGGLDPNGQVPGTFVGFHNYPLSSGFTAGGPEISGSMNVNTTLASSIESLSSINQDLHWKLQQQRLAMLLGSDQTDKQNETAVVSSVGFENPVQKPQPIMFQNLEISRPDGGLVSGNLRKGDDNGSGGIATEWFFGNSYEAATNGGGNDDGNQGGVNWNNWGDLQHQYSGLP